MMMMVMASGLVKLNRIYNLLLYSFYFQVDPDTICPLADRTKHRPQRSTEKKKKKKEKTVRQMNEKERISSN